MNRKAKKNNTTLILIIAAVIIVGLFMFRKGGIPETPIGGGTNGVWDGTSCKASDGFDGTFFQCCFNQGGQQVDCNDATKLIGLSSLAIYQDNPGIFSVSQGVRLTNTGNVDIIGTLTSASWSSVPTNTAGNTALNTAWSGMVNNPQTIVTPGGTYDWSSSIIDLQAIGGAPGSPVTYTLTLDTSAVDTGGQLTPVTQNGITRSFTVEQEGITFGVTVTF